MSNDDGNSPADIISYIGIPLAVLGVIPIFYTTINSVVTAYNIRRHLRNNAIMQAATRSSMLSGIIEVEFPVFSLAPLDRDEPEYWSLNPHPSRLKGGSWSIFNWNKLVTGKRSYRMQYSADVKEPQASVDFDELISFLVDRGAVPDPKGFRLLNMAGLWTPANTSILLNADRTESVLRVAYPDDSDGVLSLALQWRPSWAVGSGDSLPPHWMLIRDSRTVVEDMPKERLAPSKDKGKAIDDVLDSRAPPDSDQPRKSEAPQDPQEPPNTTLGRADTEQVPPYSRISLNLRIHLAMKDKKPVIDSIMDDSVVRADHRMSHAPGLSLPHLQSSPSSTWVPVICAALGSLLGYGLWTIHIPTALKELAQLDALPCGLLEMACILNEDEVPSWATPVDPGADMRERHQQFIQRLKAEDYEKTLPPAQRKAASDMRLQQRMQELSSRPIKEREKREAREREAVESARMSTEAAAKGALRLLQTREAQQPTAVNTASSKDDDKSAGKGAEAPESTGPWQDLHTAAETILYMTITEDATSQEICGILDRWRAWTNRGGMNRADLNFVLKDQGRWLNYAIILMAVLKEECSKESSLAIDLQECVKLWKRVQLG